MFKMIGNRNTCGFVVAKLAKSFGDFFVVDLVKDPLRKGSLTRSTTLCVFAAASLLLITGCTQEMMNERRVESQEFTEAFADGVASRPIPQHAIAASETALISVSVGQKLRGVPAVAAARTNNDDGYWDGKVDGELVHEIPKRLLEHHELHDLILRGQQRFNISCSPCHDHTGSGNGMVARRGFKYPPSYHTERLRNLPLGYIFNVATSGRGEMPSYGDFISTDDRWAIAAYVRTLQFSQFAPQSDLEQKDLEQLVVDLVKDPSAAGSLTRSTTMNPAPTKLLTSSATAARTKVLATFATKEEEAR